MNIIWLLLQVGIAAAIWQPKAGLTWDYRLESVPKSFAEDVQVYDVDLYAVTNSTIEALHDEGKKVICYFSAGSYEDWRDDAGDFAKSDIGKPLDGWEGENWLNITSEDVRSIMVTRLNLASEKNCDAVEPDNIDGYDNDTGFNLTEEDSVDFVEFLSEKGHALGLAVGLKNGGSIVEDLVDTVDFSVQEQCVEYDECSLYDPIYKQGKPVFHVEYPKGDKSNSKNVSTKDIEKYCKPSGFSNILKNLDLDAWLYACNKTTTVTSRDTSLAVSLLPGFFLLPTLIMLAFL